MTLQNVCSVRILDIPAKGAVVSRLVVVLLSFAVLLVVAAPAALAVEGYPPSPPPSEILPTSVEPGGGGEVQPAPDVLPEALPRTGSSALQMLVVGGVVIALGGGMVALARARERRRTG